MQGWYAVDLDGCLAFHDRDAKFDETHIGEPIPTMVERVKRWLAEGIDVRIFTARVDGHSSDAVEGMIEDWTEKHIGTRLKVTNRKDYGMIKLFDDRCIQVEENTGRLVLLPSQVEEFAL